MSDMINAFIKQTYNPHGGIQAYEEKCRDIISLRNKQQSDWVKESQQLLQRSQNISEYMTILSNLKSGEPDEKTEIHPNFSNYDHSLEMDRLDQLREKYNYVEIEQNGSNIVELSDMQIESTPICEHKDTNDIPNLTGIFDNLF